MRPATASCTLESSREKGNVMALVHLDSLPSVSGLRHRCGVPAQRPRTLTGVLWWAAYGVALALTHILVVLS